MLEKRKFLVFLHSLGITHKKLHTLFQESDNYEEIYQALSFEFLKKIYEKDDAIEKILGAKKNIDEELLEKKLQNEHIHIVTFEDAVYPKLLKEIANPPYFLYVKGTLDESPKLGVVGSRKMTDYGQKVIENIVPEVSRYFTIVSGGAFGCDSYAHKVALEAGGKTIAVVGTGIDITYPAVNQILYEQITKNSGAIISIFPLGTAGSNYTFPMRNEIIAGVSSGVLVVEAAEKSGSLITAKLALDQARDVFAVPGDIYRLNSFGCTELIQKGEAKLVMKSKDILEEYNISPSLTSQSFDLQSLDQKERQIYDILILEEKSIDDIAKIAGKNTQDISIVLSSMELMGIVAKNNSGKYQIK